MKSRQRDAGIDAFRFIGAAAVVLLHSLAEAVPNTLPKTLAAIACRFAVPFFFLVSGYYVNTTNRTRLQLAIGPFVKLGPIFLGTAAIYYAASFIIPLGHWEYGLNDMRHGPIFHLWFLPVLAISLACAGLGDAIVGLPITIAVAVGVAGVGLSITSYGDLFGSTHAGARSGWFFGTALVALGMGARRWNIRVSRSLATTMVAASYLLLITEEVLVQHIARAPSLRSHDFILLTFAFGGAVLLLARSIEPGPLTRLLAPAGRLSLGIYTFHVLFLRMWQPALSGVQLATLKIALTTLGTTLVFTWLVARIPVARWLVTTGRAD